jgi:hypothetical protein
MFKRRIKVNGFLWKTPQLPMNSVTEEMRFDVAINDATSDELCFRGNEI